APDNGELWETCVSTFSELHGFRQWLSDAIREWTEPDGPYGLLNNPTTRQAIEEVFPPANHPLPSRVNRPTLIRTAADWVLAADEASDTVAHLARLYQALARRLAAQTGGRYPFDIGS